jgi:hypothetical protein
MSDDPEGLADPSFPDVCRSIDCTRQGGDGGRGGCGPNMAFVVDMIGDSLLADKAWNVGSCADSFCADEEADVGTCEADAIAKGGEDVVGGLWVAGEGEVMGDVSNIGGGTATVSPSRDGSCADSASAPVGRARNESEGNGSEGGTASTCDD